MISMVLLIALCNCVLCAGTHDREYPTETQWCAQNWQNYLGTADGVEVRLWDATRVDYLSDNEAIEVDWAPKWAEAVGQSLYYAELTGKKPAIILLVKDMDRDRKYVYRCQTLCSKYSIRLYVEPL
jgi:hypothetical protein